MYDIFFLSYEEPMANIHWNLLSHNFPNARRIEGIEGILNAHRHCASLSRTLNFFVMDADNEILDMDFSIKLPVYDKNYVHVWRAKNPVNDMVYGWGGIKLFPKKIFVDIDKMPMDMTTSFPLKIMPEIGSITHFNTSAFSTWRSAFRECVKLARNDDQDSRERLETWCGVAHGQFSNQSLQGACAGRDYGLKYKTDAEMLLKINDWKWLKDRFNDILC